MSKAERRRLLAELPQIECQRKCQRHCSGTLVVSGEELARIARHRGRPIPDIAQTPEGIRWIDAVDRHCPLLASDGRCSVYALRPMICVLFGIMEGMECPHGCRPTRYLSRIEGLIYLLRAGVLGHEMTETEAQAWMARVPQWGIDLAQQFVRRPI